MSQIQIEVPLLLLKAAVICSAKKDIRFYLEGVAIDQGHVVSTDGHRMFYAEIANAPKDFPQIIIPREAIEFFSKKSAAIAKKHPEKVIVTIEVDGMQGTLAVHGIKEHFRRIDGKFPDWKQVIPSTKGKEYGGGTLAFNWAYMSDFQKIAQTLQNKIGSVNLVPSEHANAAAWVEFPGSIFPAHGVLMPMRQ